MISLIQNKCCESGTLNPLGPALIGGAFLIPLPALLLTSMLALCRDRFACMLRVCYTPQSECSI